MEKTALILGCGASGLAAAEYLTRRGWSLVVADTRNAPGGLARLRQIAPEARFTGGAMPPELLDGVELVVMSPGLSPEHSDAAPLVARARARGTPVVGDATYGRPGGERCFHPCGRKYRTECHHRAPQMRGREEAARVLGAGTVELSAGNDIVACVRLRGLPESHSGSHRLAWVARALCPGQDARFFGQDHSCPESGGPLHHAGGRGEPDRDVRRGRAPLAWRVGPL